MGVITAETVEEDSQMPANVLLHFALESLGDLSLGCLLLLCKHDHFRWTWLNRMVHSTAYRVVVIVLFNLLTSYLTVRAIG